MMTIIGVLMTECLYHMQLQQATGFILQKLLLEYNQYEGRNDYGYNENHTAAITSITSDSEPSLLSLQTGSNTINFGNVTNLTDNQHDSVYGQVDASSENDLHLVWQDSVPGNNVRNYDIFYTKSSDAGTTFGKEINLSDNNGFSEHPQLATSGDNVYVIWADNSLSANRDIFLARSEDGGSTFIDPLNLSDNTGDSYNQELFVFEDDVYVTWLDEENLDDNESANSSILIKSSKDGGATFDRTLDIGNDIANANSFPKVAAYNNQVYVVWNVEEEEKSREGPKEIDDRNNNTGLYFVKSSNRAAGFGESIRLNQHDQEFGEAQIATSGQHVYIVWGGSHLNQVNNLLFTKSINNGDTFSDPIAITDINDNNPSNVEISLDKAGNNSNVYIAWQSLISTAGQINREEILFKMSSDSGVTFGETVNLSKNHDISECPSLTIYEDKIYVAWEDLSPGNHEILFTRNI